MRGAPDWVVEVLSQATAVHDQTIKLAAYERAGLREVWLVHPTDRAVTVYRLRDLPQDIQWQHIARKPNRGAGLRLKMAAIALQYLARIPLHGSATAQTPEHVFAVIPAQIGDAGIDTA